MGLLRQLRKTLAGPPVGVILLYHRVAELDSDPQQLCVSPQHFAEQLEVLQQFGQPQPLREFAVGFAQRRAAAPAIVVTFDDGYADNLLVAQPLLEHYSVPATIFVATAGIEQPREFWWDDLERMLLYPGTVQGDLQMQLGAEQLQWQADGARHYSRQQFETFRRWDVLAEQTPTPRHALYRQLCREVKPLSIDARSEAWQSLTRWSNQSGDGRDSHRVMRAEELCQLTRSGLIDVGAHTVHHPMLSSLPPDQQQAEVVGSQSRLEEILGRPVETFSYPFGTRHDFDRHSVSIVRRAGFRAACANDQAAVRRRDDRYRLNRRLVRDWDGDTFARHLREWLHER